MRGKKKGQGFNTLLYGAAVVGVLIILLALFAVLNDRFADKAATCPATYSYNESSNVCTNGTAQLNPGNTAFNITVDGDKGLQEMSSQTSTIMLVLAFSVVLALIIAVVVIVRRIQQ